MSTSSPPKSFVCPQDNEISIHEHCPIDECPYHTANVGQYFAINVSTQCVFYDSTLMNNVPNSRTQISALSRHAQATVSAKAIRGLYEDSLAYMKTLYALTNTVAERAHCCDNCGYPQPLRCTSISLCADRKNWSNYVLSLYSLPAATVKRQLVWELLLADQLHVEPSALDIGRSFLNNNDHRKLASRKQSAAKLTGES